VAERCGDSCEKQNRKHPSPKTALFSRHVHQKTVNPGQIIPVFTFFWDDKSKSRRKKTGMAYAPERLSCCPCAFPNLARFHDEATTSDDGSDIGYKFNIAAGAD
jgi:hypothetical protein